MKKALNIGDLRKTVATLVVGAFIGALLLGPIATFADDDEKPYNVYDKITTTNPAPNFMLLDRDGKPVEFTIVENGVGKVLTLVEKGRRPVYRNRPDDDD